MAPVIVLDMQISNGLRYVMMFITTSNLLRAKSKGFYPRDVISMHLSVVIIEYTIHG